MHTKFLSLIKTLFFTGILLSGCSAAIGQASLTLSPDCDNGGRGNPLIALSSTNQPKGYVLNSPYNNYNSGQRTGLYVAVVSPYSATYCFI